MSGPPGTKLSRLAIWILAVPLAALSAYHASLFYYRSHPASAPEVLREDPGITLAADDLALLGVTQTAPADTGNIADTARAVLRERPLSAAALRQLALAERDMASERYGLRLALAEKVSRRDLGAQVSLFDAAAATGDYDDAIDHLDKVLTVYPQAGAAIYPVLATVIGDNEFRQAVVKRAGRPWFGGLIAGVIAAAEPLATAALVREAKLQFDDADGSLLSRLLTRLVDTGHYQEARQLALQSGRGRPKLALIGFLPQTTDPALAPLTWFLANDEKVRAQLAPGGGLSIEAQPGLHGQVASRTTALPAGRYLLHQAVGSTDAGSRLGWEVTCGAKAGTVLWRQMVPVPAGDVRYRSPVSVPANCSTQRWKLTVTTAEGQRPVDVRIWDLQLQRQ